MNSLEIEKRKKNTYHVRPGESGSPFSAPNLYQDHCIHVKIILIQCLVLIKK